MSIRGLTLTKIFGVIFVVLCVALGVQSLRVESLSQRLAAAKTKVEAFEKCEAAIKIEKYSPECPTQIGELFIAHQNTKSQLARLELERAAAIARAETRATELQTRKSQDDKIIQSAPRTADGRIICDAKCMRERKL